ncbi:MAG: hypothetical protein GKR94_08425 [Gammaproteobacteria bacterium]|nr:hypothetical protein [Gammaproteobacteria bacterium]
MKSEVRTRQHLTVQDNAATGIALTVGNAALVPLVESGIKLLGGTTSSAQIVLTRFAVQVVFTALLLALIPKLRQPLPSPLWPLLLRGCLLALGSGLLYAGLAVMPLVESSAIFFIEPLLLTCLAGLLLGESVGWGRLIAVTVALALAVAALIAAGILNVATLAPHLPTLSEAGLLLGIGVGATVTNLLLTQALRITPVSVIGPFPYLESAPRS